MVLSMLTMLGCGLGPLLSHVDVVTRPTAVSSFGKPSSPKRALAFCLNHKTRQPGTPGFSSSRCRHSKQVLR